MPIKTPAIQIRVLAPLPGALVTMREAASEILGVITGRRGGLAALWPGNAGRYSVH